MAQIVVDIKTISGESEIADYTGEVEAVGISESIISGTASATGARVADIEVIRFKDTASPKLAQACASGSNIGDVTVTVLADIGGIAQKTMEYTLKSTYVKRISYETLDQENLSHQSGGLADAPQGLALSGGFGNREMERVLFNAEQVVWTHSTYDSATGGVTASLERGYNLKLASNS